MPMATGFPKEAPKVGTKGLGTVDRALDVLELAARRGGPIALGEVASELGMSRSTAHRLLVTLRRRGFVRLLPDGHRYTIGIKSFEIGATFLNVTSLRSVSFAEMEVLSEISQETVHLVTLEGMEIVYIEKITSPRPYSLDTRVGSRSPAYCTAAGKAILAFLEPAALDKLLAAPLKRYTPQTITDRDLLREELARVRGDYCAEDREEIEPNLYCVAAPILDHRREVVGAIGLAGPGARIRPRLPAYRDHVRAAARRISRSVGSS
jgi:DNA-binding IclR family transcriptional regulator